MGQEPEQVCRYITMIHVTLPTYMVQNTFSGVQPLVHTGLPGIPIPSLPATEPWVNWFLIGLCILLALTHMVDSYTIPECFNISFKVKERSSIFTKTTIQNPWSHSLLFLFQLGTLALTAHALMQPEQTPFTLATTLRFFLVLGIFFLVKYIFMQLLAYVFFRKNPNADLWIKTYFQILSAYCLILLPILIIYIYIPEEFIVIPHILLALNTLIAVIILVAKLFQLFFQKMLALFYIMLYLCTLEIFPVSGLIFVLRICT